MKSLITLKHGKNNYTLDKVKILGTHMNYRLLAITTLLLLVGVFIYTKSSIKPPNEHDRRLLQAISNNDPAEVTCALKDGANVNKKGLCNTTPLIFACHPGFKKELRPSDMPDCCPWLSDPDEPWRKKYSALINTRCAIIKCLLDAGADIDARDENEMTALHWACRSGEFGRDKIRILIQAGAHVNAVNNRGNTPMVELLSLVEGWSTETLQIFIEAGADPLVINKENKIAFDYVSKECALWDLLAAAQV